MDLRQLRYFVAIVQCGSITRASAQLNVAQPALSMDTSNAGASLTCRYKLDHDGVGHMDVTRAGQRIDQDSALVLVEQA